MSNMKIDEAIKRVNFVFPYLKPVCYAEFKNLFIFQMSKADGSVIHFDNLIAIDRSTGLPFPFNPLKYGKEYANSITEFIMI